MPSKKCLGAIYSEKYLIVVHTMLCALWNADERVDYEEWCIGLTEISLSQYLWMLRQRLLHTRAQVGVAGACGVPQRAQHDVHHDQILLAIDGAEAFSARHLASALGCGARPQEMLSSCAVSRRVLLREEGWNCCTTRSGVVSSASSND